MTDQEIIDDIFDSSIYFYPDTFKFLSSLPSTVKTDTGIRYNIADVIDYCSKHNLNIPESKGRSTGQ